MLLLVFCGCKNTNDFLTVQFFLIILLFLDFYINVYILLFKKVYLYIKWIREYFINSFLLR